MGEDGILIFITGQFVIWKLIPVLLYETVSQKLSSREM